MEFNIGDIVVVFANEFASPMVKYVDGEEGKIIDVVLGSQSEGYLYHIQFYNKTSGTRFIRVIPEKYLVMKDMSTMAIIETMAYGSRHNKIYSKDVFKNDFFKNLINPLSEEGLYYLRSVLEGLIEEGDFESARIIGEDYNFYYSIVDPNIVKTVNKTFLLKSIDKV